MPLERRVADWLAADAASGATPPSLADAVIAATATRRPMPRAIAVVRAPTMAVGRRVVVGVPRRQLLLVAALFALLVGLVAAGALALLRPTTRAEVWSGYRGDASRTSVAVHGPIGNPVARWVTNVGNVIENDLAIARGLVMVPTRDGVLRALGADDGRERWRFSAPGAMKGPVTDGDNVYVADGDGRIHALRIEDGVSIWQTAPTFPATADLIVSGGRLFLGTGSGELVVLDTRSGAELWRRTVSAGRPVHAPAVASGILVVADDDSVLVAFDAATGAERWRKDVSDRPVGTPVVANGVAYLGGGAQTPGARLIALDLGTGQERWRVERNIYAPSVSDGIGYTGSGDGLVSAIDLTTGATRWTASFQGVVRAPVIAGDVVYVAADGERRLVALERATGRPLWSRPVDAEISCCIAVADGIVYAATVAGTVYAWGGDGSALTASAPPPSSPSPSPSSSSPSPAPSGPSPSGSVALLPTSVDWAVTSGADDFLPWSLTLAPDGRLWATEASRNRFSIFTADGEFIESWGTAGSDPGQFHLTAAHDNPYGQLAFAPDGSFYVLDTGNSRVQHFDARRKLVRTWGSFGSGPGQFLNAVGIAVGRDGHVHVLDDGRGVIETYDAGGRVLGRIGAFPPAITPNDGANQLAIGPNGDFFVTVASPNLVAEIDATGNLVTTFGGPGSGVGAFTEQPTGMAWDATGRLYVTSGPQTKQPGVLVYDRDGTFVGGFGPRGAAKDELGFPWGIVVTDHGIYVADAGALPEYGLSSYIRKFAPIPAAKP